MKLEYSIEKLRTIDQWIKQKQQNRGIPSLGTLSPSGIKTASLPEITEKYGELQFGL